MHFGAVIIAVLVSTKIHSNTTLRQLSRPLPEILKNINTDIYKYLSIYFDIVIYYHENFMKLDKD